MAENRIHAGRNPRRTSIKDERTDEYMTHVSGKTKATHTELCDTTLKPCRNLSSRPSSMRRLPIFPGHVTFSAKWVWWRDLAWRVGLSWPGTQRSCCFRAQNGRRCEAAGAVFPPHLLGAAEIQPFRTNGRKILISIIKMDEQFESV